MFLKLYHFIQSELTSLCNDPDFQSELRQIAGENTEPIGSLEEIGNTSNYVVIDFNFLFSCVVTETLSELFKRNSQTDKISNWVMQTDLKKEELGYALERLDVIKAKIGRYVFNKLFKIQRSQRLTKDLLLRKMDTVIKVSRDEIATEFGIENKTLNLWITQIYGFDKYKDKEIRFSEYLDLYIRCFVSSDATSFNFEHNRKHFQNLFDKNNKEIKRVYSKKDIIELSDSDYKTARAQVLDHNKLEFYATMNIFPYTLAQEIIQGMNGKNSLEE